jgi:O-methyltransferase
MTTILRDWELDTDFAPFLQRIRGRTLVSEDRCYLLYQLALRQRKLPGDVVEFGVYRGGTATLFSDLFTLKQVHLYDSFEGLPEVLPVDGFHKGDFAEISAEDIRHIYGLPNVIVHKGFFNEFTLVPPDICFAHIDCDIYQSILDASLRVWPHLVAGGVIVYDDYGFSDCWGAKPAVDEFCRQTSANKLTIGNGQCLIVK